MRYYPLTAIPVSYTHLDVYKRQLLENVTLDAEGHIDFADKSVTENTRVSYPINHIQNIVRPIDVYKRQG